MQTIARARSGWSTCTAASSSRWLQRRRRRFPDWATQGQDKSVSRSTANLPAVSRAVSILASTPSPRLAEESPTRGSNGCRVAGRNGRVVTRSRPPSRAAPRGRHPEMMDHGRDVIFLLQGWSGPKFALVKHRDNSSIVGRRGCSASTGYRGRAWKLLRALPRRSPAAARRRPSRLRRRRAESIRASS